MVLIHSCQALLCETPHEGREDADMDLSPECSSESAKAHRACTYFRCECGCHG